MKLLETPCPKCDWKYQGFHICLDLPPSVMRRVEDDHKRDSNGDLIIDETSRHAGRKSRAKDPSMSHSEAIAAGIRAKFENDPRRIARDEDFVRLYDREKMSMKQISKLRGYAVQTVMAALHRAQDAREITIRPANPR